MPEIYEKYGKLQDNLRELGSVAVAFSGGADSAFLLKAAKDALGDHVLAVTAAASSFPERELKEAKEFCTLHHIPQVVFLFRELEIEGFRSNPKNRCYICKHALFERVWEIAGENGISFVAEGSNLDDEGDYRPGLLAVSQLNVNSPLREAGFTKEEIRSLSKEMGLSTWNKPSFACLASRFSYGEIISEDKLNMVGQAEQFLFDKGFHQVRVRIHGRLARIELLSEEIEQFMDRGIRDEVYRYLREMGFLYITLDLGGYRTGSMNEIFTDGYLDKSNE